MIETIVFDLGGVLIDWNPRYLYRKIFADDHQMETFLKEVCHGEWNERQDAGRPFQEAIDQRVREFPHYESEIRAYFERWPEMIPSAIEGTVEIFRKIKERKRYRIYALSNWSAETFPFARARFEFFNWFDGVLLSGEEKLTKPDAEFFNLLSLRYGVRPESSVFIDDVEKNVRASRDLGYHSILFNSPQELESELDELGILI